MPFTPLHLSVLALALIFFGTLYIPAVAVAAVILDIEAFYLLFIAQAGWAHHGIYHTYAAATLVGLAVGLLLLPLRKWVDALMTGIGLGQQRIPPVLVVLSALFGAYSHIFLDSLSNTDMMPFLPFSEGNPFLRLLGPPDIGAFIIYTSTSLGVIAALLLWRARARLGRAGSF